MTGTLARIFLRPSARTPVREVAEAEAVAGRGLAGDHAGGGARQVTVLSEEAWEAACRELGRVLNPGGRRANLVVRGFDLRAATGGELRIGECRVEIVGETRPCRLMEDVADGLQRALGPETRGGVYGRITRGGRVAVGMEARVVEIAAPRQLDLELAP